MEERSLSHRSGASGGRHAAKKKKTEHSEPCPSPAPAKRTGRRRHSEKFQQKKKEVGRPYGAAGSAFEATEPGFTKKKKSLTAKAQSAR